ncbi:hypothetical protein LBW89_06645 [Paenibacillus sp. alder61]|uniref:hypothetical protein n=1 Tax=Paenibacillus sp. alder61 TaxID=2862948 RepID=UPI001CD4700B|nr:hypothetical protein [Paenibacillus sp. alder61]MCA1292690.1 hypothetical protein [Paenibacillus sp. alder61]
MLFILLMAGAIVNGALCAVGGAILFMGVVFYLIGLPQFKRSEKTKVCDGIRESLPIFFTLLMILFYMVITYWCARTGGTLAFRSVPSADDLSQAKKLVLLGIGQGLFSLITFKWILPGAIGELKLDRKHKWGIAAGVIVTMAGGGAAWLTAV